MSATGSPRTVNVTRSPARTASSTRVVSFRSSLTPTFTCYTVALRPANRRRPHRAPRREPELTTSPRGLRCRYRCPAHAACGRPPHMWAVDISFPRERAGRAWPSCSSRSTCPSRSSTGRGRPRGGRRRPGRARPATGPLRDRLPRRRGLDRVLVRARYAARGASYWQVVAAGRVLPATGGAAEAGVSGPPLLSAADKAHVDVEVVRQIRPRGIGGERVGAGKDGDHGQAATIAERKPEGRRLGLQPSDIRGRPPRQRRPRCGSA